MKQEKTTRLLFPQWQGGNNPNYSFGAELLKHIVPKNNNQKTFTVETDRNFSKELSVLDGIEGKEVLLTQLQNASNILNEEQPDKVIVLGGDCSVSQAPFDYLKGKYKNKLGILWLDAHPDVSDLTGAKRFHEMVLGNLIGHGTPELSEKVENHYKPNEVFLAGLIYEDLRQKDQDVNRLDLAYGTPKELETNSDKIIDWIEKNEIEYLAIHFDLDVLNPIDYRSIYPAEPYLESFGAAIGELTLNNIGRILADVSKKAEIVGFSITEHLPWDAINLRKTLSEISIFNNK